MVKCASCGKDKPESETQKFPFAGKTYDVCKDCYMRVKSSPNIYLHLD